jgi:hypothetical protein
VGIRHPRSTAHEAEAARDSTALKDESARRIAAVHAEFSDLEKALAWSERIEDEGLRELGRAKAARTSILAPQRGQVSGSSSHVRAMSRAQFCLRLRVDSFSVSSLGGRDLGRLESGGVGEGEERRSFCPVPVGGTREVGFARGGGRFTGGSWDAPCFPPEGSGGGNRTAGTGSEAHA